MDNKKSLFGRKPIPALVILALIACAVFIVWRVLREGGDGETAFYFGVDLSYVNEVEDCGAVFLEGGIPQDPYDIFENHGANLVRARLWHDPTWTDYSTLEDVKKTFSRAEQAGMATLLDFHYSDDWADPGTQNIPAAWEDIEDLDELAQAVYQYTYDVLLELDREGLMPDFVQVGNETNSGMLKKVMELDWSRDAKLFNAGIQAVRDAAKKTHTSPQIILHIAQPENTGWWFREAQSNGVTDFDVIGISYYPQWSSYSITDMGSQVTYLRQAFGKEVMVVETAYPWTYDAAPETADNILNTGLRGYPASPAGQRQFMIDLTQSLINNGALGVVYWEPAWVSTECFTRWGQGSHWENATFFDFQNGNELHEGIDFLSYPYLYPTKLADGIVEEDYGEPLLQDATSDNLEQHPHLDLAKLYVTQDADSLFIALEIAGDIFTEQWGSYLVYMDTTHDAQGAIEDVGKRPITVADPYKPEFRLDMRVVERNDTVNGNYEFYAWDGESWQAVTLTGGAAIQNGDTSVIEVQIPLATLGFPQIVNLGVVSTGRGRVHTAGDILGSASSPADWSAPVTLDQFGQFNISYP